MKDGWEMRRTKEGKLYYVDTNTKNTFWTLPPHAKVEQSSLCGICIHARHSRAGWIERGVGEEAEKGMGAYFRSVVRPDVLHRPQH